MDGFYFNISASTFPFHISTLGLYSYCTKYHYSHNRELELRGGGVRPLVLVGSKRRQPNHPNQGTAEAVPARPRSREGQEPEVD